MFFLLETPVTTNYLYPINCRIRLGVNLHLSRISRRRCRHTEDTKTITQEHFLKERKSKALMATVAFSVFTGSYLALKMLVLLKLLNHVSSNMHHQLQWNLNVCQLLFVIQNVCSVANDLEPSEKQKEKQQHATQTWTSYSIQNNDTKNVPFYMWGALLFSISLSIHIKSPFKHFPL